MINNPTPASQARAPRGLVYANGQQVAGLIEFEVTSNGYYQADKFSATLSLSAQPAAMNAAWWLAQNQISLELLAGFPANPVRPVQKSDLGSLLTGRVDEIEMDPINGLIHLTGRDRTADFLDNKTVDKFQNLTASQIAQQLAARHGMQAVVTPTTTKAGVYYAYDHAKLTNDVKEWDLLTYLAQQEQYMVYVRGNTLYFQPHPTASSNPYVIRYAPPTRTFGSPTCNATEVKLCRNLTVARDVVVEVRSWNHKQKKGFTVKASAVHVKKQGGGGTAQTYTYTKPGLTKDQAQQWANAKLHEISQHEMRLDAELPGDNLLWPEVPVVLQGTGTPFDQLYFTGEVSRHYTLDGYTMRVEAKNHPTESEALV